MNIYLHVEISARELDSKLVLAILAAARGHEVIVSDNELIEKGLRRGWLPPGIFHTKSLTPSKAKIERHKSLIKRGSKITSIDEEANIDRFGYETFSKLRYSEETISLSSGVFAWGDEDFETLKKDYSKYSDKIFKTGSPRVDTWRPFFESYWSKPKNIIKKPFLLISSNLASIFDHLTLKERIKAMSIAGYFDRVPGQLKEKFLRRSSDSLKAIIFVEAIKYLSKHNNGYDIVIRPHPVEDIYFWKILLKNTPNVHVIREGSISPWINKSFAVMHHACTTAIECTVSQKPLITYVASELKDHYYQNNLSNQLGYRVETKEDLLTKINNLYSEFKQNVIKKKVNSLPSLITSKIYIDNNEFASEKIIKIWEKISIDQIYKPINLISLRVFILKMKINRFIGDILRFFIKSRFDNFGTTKDKQKFTPFEKTDIQNRIIKLQQLLSLDRKIEFKFLSKNTILIKRRKN